MFTRRSPPLPGLPKKPEEQVQEHKEKSIHDLSFIELKAFHEHVGTVLAQRAAQARLDFKRDFVDRMAALGLTLDDLKPTKDKKERKPRETKPKYQHPDNASLHWSGRGRPPVWMQELLDQGRQLDEFAIGSDPAADPLS